MWNGELDKKKKNPKQKQTSWTSRANVKTRKGGQRGGRSQEKEEGMQMEQDWELQGRRMAWEATGGKELGKWEEKKMQGWDSAHWGDPQIPGR